jgi:hypothetical protein
MIHAAPAETPPVPCLKADATCQERLPVGGGKFLLVYRNRPLTARNDSIERAFILVHGLQRDGDVYYRSALAATTEAGRMEHTLVIAPQFHVQDGGAQCHDKVAPNEVAFACRGWQDGVATPDGPLSSFAATDRLLQVIDNRAIFPALKEIVVAGHSAGGQFVQRYAATNRLDGKLTVPLRYVVANPSSYLYLESWRPVADPGAACPAFDRYKFGLKGLTGYQAESGREAIRTAYPRRSVTYLLGELDTTDEHNMDKSCSAMAQGPNRLERGLAYYQRLQQTFQSVHRLLKVPGCAHSGDCMYRSENGRKAVFGN